MPADDAWQDVEDQTTRRAHVSMSHSPQSFLFCIHFLPSSPIRNSRLPKRPKTAFTIPTLIKTRGDSPFEPAFKSTCRIPSSAAGFSLGTCIELEVYGSISEGSRHGGNFYKYAFHDVIIGKPVAFIRLSSRSQSRSLNFVEELHPPSRYYHSQYPSRE